jgi:hypothetical protein
MVISRSSFCAAHQVIRLDLQMHMGVLLHLRRSLTEGHQVHYTMPTEGHPLRHKMPTEGRQLLYRMLTEGHLLHHRMPTEGHHHQVEQFRAHQWEGHHRRTPMALHHPLDSIKLLLQIGGCLHHQDHLVVGCLRHLLLHQGFVANFPELSCKCE